MQTPMLGEVSGLDIHEMIDDLMEAERKPIERKQEDIKEAEETKEHWGDVNTRLDSLQGSLNPLLDSETFTATEAESSNDDVVGATVTGEPVEGEYEVHVEQLATRQMVASDPAAADPPENYEEYEGWGENGRIANPHEALGLSGEFALGTEGEEELSTIEVDEEDSLNEIIDAINREAGSVNARWIQAEEEDYRLVLESEEEGTEGEIEVEDPDGVMNSLGILDDEGDFAHELREARDAKLSLFGDGEFDEDDPFSVTRSSNTIDDLIEGVQLDLRQEGSATVNVEQDVDGAVESVEEFIEEYNKTVDKIRDTRGIGGPLQGDTTLSRIRNQMRTPLQGEMPEGENDNEPRTLYDLGLNTTGEGRIKSEGYLEIEDEDQLRDAIRNQPERVHYVLGNEGDDEEPDGVLRQLDEVLDTYLDREGIIQGRKDRLDNQVDRLQDRIRNVEERAAMREERLRDQFIDMELALSQMEGQSEFIQDFMSF